MLNKKLVATLLIGCFGFATAQADGVTVNFEAQVLGTVCTLTSSASTVNLGVIKDNEQNQTTPTQFTVSLQDCGAGVQYATVKVTQESSTILDNVLKAGAGTGTVSTGKADIAFYEDDVCQTALPLKTGFRFDATQNGTDPNNVTYTMNNASKNIWVRLEKPEKVGTISEWVTFTAEYH